jgi:peroxiredoxin
MSFPILRRVYERFRNNSSVVIFAVDCWERQPDSTAVLGVVRKFQSENKLPWRVLLDVSNDVVRKYGVNAVPTQFVIDRSGTIAFKTMGFEGPPMEPTLIQQVEMLLAEHSENPH